MVTGTVLFIKLCLYMQTFVLFHYILVKQQNRIKMSLFRFMGGKRNILGHEIMLLKWNINKK